MEWQFQNAKNKLSELVGQAQAQGPQEITRHGKKTAVVLSIEDYRRLKGRKGSLAEFFRKSPLTGLSFERAKDSAREVDL